MTMWGEADESDFQNKFKDKKPLNIDYALRKAEELAEILRYPIFKVGVRIDSNMASILNDCVHALRTIRGFGAEIEGLKSQIVSMEEEQSYCTFKDTGLSEMDALCNRLLNPFPPNDAELNKTVAMLRKLATDNQKLTADCVALHSKNKSLLSTINSMAQTNEAIGKRLIALQGDGEPVAWRKYYSDGFGYSGHPVNGGEPLYNRPAKIVTDEDIDEVAKPFLKWIKETFGPEEKVIKDYRGFSKALLRKVT